MDICMEFSECLLPNQKLMGGVKLTRRHSRLVAKKAEDRMDRLVAGLPDPRPSVAWTLFDD